MIKAVAVLRLAKSIGGKVLGIATVTAFLLTCDAQNVEYCCDLFLLRHEW